MHARGLLIPVLAILCVALGGIAVAELTGSDASTPELISTGAPASSKIDGAALNENFSLPTLSSFASVGERPLFSPDRRPPAQSVDGTGAWSSFSLSGIIITPQSREALVSHGKPPTIAHLAEGQIVEGWTVSAIYPDHVVFRDRLTEHELKLIDKGSPPPPAPPARRPAPY